MRPQGYPRDLRQCRAGKYKRLYRQGVYWLLLAGYISGIVLVKGESFERRGLASGVWRQRLNFEMCRRGNIPGVETQNLSPCQCNRLQFWRSQSGFDGDVEQRGFCNSLGTCSSIETQDFCTLRNITSRTSLHSMIFEYILNLNSPCATSENDEQNVKE